MSQAAPAMAPGPSARRFRLASPATALVTGAALLALMIADFPLSRLAHQNMGAGGGGTPICFSAPFAVVGSVLAWRKPRNRLGWIFLGLAAPCPWPRTPASTSWRATGCGTAGCRSAGWRCLPSPPGPWRSC